MRPFTNNSEDFDTATAVEEPAPLAPVTESVTIPPPARCFCGSLSVEIRWPNRLPWLHRCRDCGVEFTHPQPSDEELAEIYGKDYFAGFGDVEDRNGAYRTMMRLRANAILDIAEERFGKGRLLDVGSGMGALLDYAHRRGWDAWGLEPIPYAVASAEQIVRERTIAQSIEGYAHRDPPFDIITCLDVFEHVRRPSRVAWKFRQLLRIGGGLIITTLDIQSLARRILRWRWPHFHRDHLWYFTRRSLVTLIEDANFDVLGCRKSTKLFTMRYLLCILSQPHSSPLLRLQARLAMKVLPTWLLKRHFALREGMILVAQAI